jgi:cbb3-type cytochrome oxidase subunit 3
MNPEAGKAWFQVAVFITLVSVALLFFEQPGTAEFVITVTTLVIGLVFIGIVVFAAKRANR